MKSARSWSENLKVVLPLQAATVDLSSSRFGGTRALRGRVEAAQTGETVVICDNRIRSRGRCRRFARRTGLEVVRELLVLPSFDQPAFFVEDSKEARDFFFNTVMPVPPGGALMTRLMDRVLRIGQAASLWNAVGALLPGRVVMARKT